MRVVNVLSGAVFQARRDAKAKSKVWIGGAEYTFKNGRCKNLALVEDGHEPEAVARACRMADGFMRKLDDVRAEGVKLEAIRAEKAKEARERAAEARRRKRLGR